MFRRALASLPQPKRTVIVALTSTAEKMSLNEGEIVVRIEHTPVDQTLSTELGLHHLDESDCIVSSCDHEIVLSPQKWQQFIGQPNCDAAIFTVVGFPGARRSPHSFSYVDLYKNEDNAHHPFCRVRAVGIKKPFTNHSVDEPLLVGSFWFSSKAILQNGIEGLKKLKIDSHRELYLDEVFNILINAGVIVRHIPLEGYINWGDHESYKEALYWKNIFVKQEA